MGDNLPAVRQQAPTQVSVYDRIGDPLAAAAELGAFISQSGMFGNLNESQGRVLAWHCLAKKRDPFDVKREYHIFEDGQMSMRSDAMAAQFLAKGGKIRWLSDLNDHDEARASFTDYDNNEYEWSIAYEDVRQYAEGRSGVKKNWRQSKPDMLRARLTSKAIRMLDPGINGGVYTPEEVRDFGPADAGQVEGKALFGGQTAEQEVPAPAPKEAEVEVVEAAPEEPEKSIDDIRRVLETRFLGIASDTMIDAFFVRKGWLEQGDTFRGMDDEHIRKAYAQYEKIMQLLPAWVKGEKMRMAEEKKAAAAKKAAEGGAV